MKAITAAPPDVLRVDEKHLREYSVFNVCGVIITTNHKTDGIYLPADDRRHFVAWSTLSKDDFRRRLLARALWLVRQRRQRGRRRLSRQPRSVRLRSQGTAAEDRSLLGDRQRQPRAGGRRTRRRARRPRAAGCRDARSGGKPSVAAAADLRRMAARQGQRPPHPAPLRGLRLRRRAQPQRHRGTLEDQRPSPHDLRQGRLTGAQSRRRRLQARRGTARTRTTQTRTERLDTAAQAIERITSTAANWMANKDWMIGARSTPNFLISVTQFHNFR